MHKEVHLTSFVKSKRPTR